MQGAARAARTEVKGDRVGSEDIELEPGPVRPGDYFFDIGTAGAASLVLQTLQLPLALAPGTSSGTIRGGTHVPWSPCFHFLYWHWRPLLARIGLPFDLTMALAGFYQKGGGELQARIPGEARPTPLRLTERGPLCPIITPASCRKCGFRFDEHKLHKPNNARVARVPGSARR